MKISKDILEGIIGHSVITPDAQDQNRLSRRILVSKRATLAHAGSAVRIPITIVDVAAGGAGFIYLSPLVPGEQFILRVTGRDGNHLTAHCIVRWFMKTCTGRFRIGSEFIRRIDDMRELQPSADSMQKR
jgi:hypothetical protein